MNVFFCKIIDFSKETKTFKYSLVDSSRVTILTIDRVWEFYLSESVLIKLINSCPSLTSLRLYDCVSLSDNVIAHISVSILNQLTELIIDEKTLHSLTDASLHHLATHCHSLTKLHLMCLNIHSETVLRVLDANPHLTTLQFSMQVVIGELQQSPDELRSHIISTYLRMDSVNVTFIGRYGTLTHSTPESLLPRRVKS